MHFSDTSAIPTQSAPPNAGAGLLQDLVVFLSPPPHVAEHTDQVPKLDHPPLTVIEFYFIIKPKPFNSI